MVNATTHLEGGTAIPAPLRNAALLIGLCPTWAERVRMGVWLVGYAMRRWRGSGPVVHTSVVDGMRLTLDWTAAEHVPLREVIGRGEYWSQPGFRPAPGQTVVDAGANAGVFTVVVGRRIGSDGRLIAIEPNATVLPRLRANVTHNGLDGTVSVIAAALGAVAGTGRMEVGRNSTIGMVRAQAGPGGDVAVVTLDRLMKDLALPRIDLLKVDVEGAEVQALQGAGEALARTARAVVEVSDPADVAAVMDLLRVAGFEDVHPVEAGPDSGATLVFAARPGAA